MFTLYRNSVHTLYILRNDLSKDNVIYTLNKVDLGHFSNKNRKQTFLVEKNLIKIRCSNTVSYVYLMNYPETEVNF